MLGLTGLWNKIQRTTDRRKPGKTGISSELTQTLHHSIDTLVFAHRGSKANRPENTLSSFHEAVRVGADGIELDVHLSLDSQLIVIHDEKVNRTTNGKGWVRKMTRAEIQALDAGRWFRRPEFYGEHIPTLPEVLSKLSEWGFTGILNIEIKTDKYHYRGIEKKLSDLMTSQSRPFSYLYSSFNIKSLEILSLLEPDSEISYLMAREKKISAGLNADYVDSIHPKKNWLIKQPFKAMTTSKPTRFWTVNRERDMIAAFAANASGIITDFPEKAIQIREQLKKRH